MRLSAGDPVRAPRVDLVRHTSLTPQVQVLVSLQSLSKACNCLQAWPPLREYISHTSELLVQMGLMA